MRFLFTCIPGLGHLNPLAPLAHALIGAGHQVAFATAAAFGDAVIRAGLDFIPAGLDWDERRLLETMPELRTVERIFRGEWLANTIFLDRSPRRMIPDLLAIVPQWRPDVIVSGSFEYAGALVAEKLGLPYASGNYTIQWDRWILKHALGRQLGKLRVAAGLPPDPELLALGRHLDLCSAPPSWSFAGGLLRPALKRMVIKKVLSRDLPLRQRLWGLRAALAQRIFARALRLRPERSATGATTHFIAESDYYPEVGHPEAGPGPDWLAAMPRQPTVFVSLGTVFSAEYPEVFDTILAGLGDKAVNLVMTLGGKGDPARFGPQPPNVRIVAFMTQDELAQLLPHVDLGINHAGHSSVMEALLRGIPLVLLPLVADAPMNTQMCLYNGVTPELPPDVWGLSPKGLPIIRADRLTPAIIANAAMQALNDPRYREAARRMQQELAARPGLGEAVRLLEDLARRHATQSPGTKEKEIL